MKQSMAAAVLMGCAAAVAAQEAKTDVTKTLNGYISRMEQSSFRPRMPCRRISIRLRRAMASLRECARSRSR